MQSTTGQGKLTDDIVHSIGQRADQDSPRCISQATVGGAKSDQRDLVGDKAGKVQQAEADGHGGEGEDSGNPPSDQEGWHMGPQAIKEQKQAEFHQIDGEVTKDGEDGAAGESQLHVLEKGRRHGNPAQYKVLDAVCGRQHELQEDEGDKLEYEGNHQGIVLGQEAAEQGEAGTEADGQNKGAQGKESPNNTLSPSRLESQET